MKMSQIGHLVLKELQKSYPVEAIDIGEDACLKKKGLTLRVESYDIAGLGHLCLLSMSGMMGLLKMETVVLSVWEKDVPLLNLDAFQFAASKARIAELYDTMLSPLDRELERLCSAVKYKDSDLKDYESEEKWYSSLRYPFSYAKTSGCRNTRMELSSMKYLQAFLTETERANNCDSAAKQEKIRSFAQGLLDNGGAAVDQVRKLFGEEFARRLVLSYMYGVKTEAPSTPPEEEEEAS